MHVQDGGKYDIDAVRLHAPFNNEDFTCITLPAFVAELVFSNLFKFLQFSFAFPEDELQCETFKSVPNARNCCLGRLALKFPTRIFQRS